MDIRNIMMALLRYKLDGAKESVKKEIGGFVLREEDLSLLYELSKKHDMAHMVGAALDELGLLNVSDVSQIAQKFRDQYMIALMRYQRIKYELTRLSALLEEEKIPYIPLKGSVIRNSYPEPWMRTSCDIDVLVHPEDIERIELLVKEKLNYSPDARGSHDVAFFSESGIHVELHYDLIEDIIFPEAGKILSSVWESSIPASESEYRMIMSDELFYFYHIAHMAKHFVGGGCGVRPFMDIWILQGSENFDEQKRDALLDAGKLLKFEKVAREVSRCWFDGEAANPITQAVSDFIFEGGVYGDFEHHVAMQQVRNGGRVRYALSKIFLPYDIIKFHYPVLQKHRWLTPFCEVRRWFKLLFCGGAKRSISTLKKNGAISAEEARNNAMLLDNLGLKN